MADYPLISVIVLSFKSATTVRATLESIRQQDYPGPVELVITDDASPDDSVAIIQEWIVQKGSHFSSCELLTAEENGGVVHSLNKACHRAKGEWIKAIAGDDILATHALTALYTYATEGGTPKAFVSTAVQTFCKDEELAQSENLPVMLGKKDLVIGLDDVLKNPLFFLPAPSFFLNHDVLRKIGYYPTLLRNVEDAPLMYTLLSKGYKLYHMKTPVVFYRVHDASITKAKGHIFLLKQQCMAFDALLMPCYDRFKRFYLDLYLCPIRYMIRTNNQSRGRFKLLKLVTKIVRNIYRILFWPVLSRPTKLSRH